MYDNENEAFFKARNELNRHRRENSKSKKPRKHVPKAIREEKRAEKRVGLERAVKSFAKGFGGKPTAVSKSLKKMLNGFDIKTGAGQAPFRFWKDIGKSDHRLLVKNANRQYVSALAYIAGVFLMLRSVPPMKLELYIFALMELTGTKEIASDIELLSAIHKMAIYQDRVTDKQKRSARVTITRDVRAILWLLHLDLAPQNFVAYQKENGGGSDSWHRAYNEKFSPQPPDSVPPEDGDTPSPVTNYPTLDLGSHCTPGSKPMTKAQAVGTALEPRATKSAALIVNEKKIQDCICASPKVCADRAIAHRFKLKSGRYLFTIHVGDESYAGAHIVGAIELGMPGPSASIKMRHLRRLLQPIIERGTPYDI